MINYIQTMAKYYVFRLLVCDVCWFKSLEYPWRINIVFVQTTAGRKVHVVSICDVRVAILVALGANLKCIALLMLECDG